MRLILASRSPRRADLLTAAGYAFEVHVVDVDERVRPGEHAEAYVGRLAREKASRALADLSSTADHAPATADLVVIGADTAVVVGDEILGKPRDAEDAGRMLRRLSGRVHRVMTGVSVCSPVADVTHVEVTLVRFIALSEEQISWYVASEEGIDKAGAYAIQGLASRLIPSIEGAYANVVGLPIAPLDGLIQRVSGPATVLASDE